MAIEHATRLVEREGELAILRQLLADARAGRGRVAVVEGPAGQGKTSILRELRALAAAEGFQVLTAVGAELERDFTYGLARQLFEPALHGATDEERGRLLAGAAGMGGAIFAAAGAGAPPDTGADASHGRLHGLYWLTANLAEERPVLLAVDDAHWGDRLSLRFLDMLARRAEDLPVLLAVAMRPHEPGAEHDLLDGIAAAAAAEALRPRDLSADAVAALVAGALGATPEAAFAAACHHTTGGNPLLVAELLRTIAADGFAGEAREIDALRRAVPSSIGRTVVARLRRLSPAALSLARSLAVLADGSRLGRVAALAGVAREEAEAQLGLLTRAGLVAGDRLAFVHPMVRAAVAADLPATERGAWHRRAARLLAGDGAGDQEVATHLLLTEPEDDADVAATLARAGRRALAEGVPDVAVRLLRRALAEPPGPAELGDVRLSLALAAVRSGEPDVLPLLEGAMSTDDPVAAARAAPVLMYALIMRDRAAEAVVHVQRALALTREADSAVAADLEDDLLDVLPYGEDLMDEYRAAIARAAGQDRPIALVHAAHQRLMEGAPAAEVLPVLRRAFADGRLIEQVGTERFTPYWGIGAMIRCDAAAEARDLLDQVRAAATRSGSRVASASLAWVQFRWERLFGDLRRAEDDARAAFELLGTAGTEAGAALCGLSLVSTLLDRGEIAEADEVMRGLPLFDYAAGLVGFHALRGRLRHLQGRHEEALADLEEQFRRDGLRGWALTDRDEAHATHVDVLLALGRAEAALAAAERQVALHRSRGVASAEANALLARARACEDGGGGLEDSAAAVAAARRSPSRFILAHALAGHGAALRRAGQRAACREPLAEARDLARRSGARALEERAHQELVVAGARPQRIALRGVDALTAAERRVAELAADGLRNRDIAETLFVTLKTVEVHLGRTYGKLGIQGRSQLAGALGETAVAS